MYITIPTLIGSTPVRPALAMASISDIHVVLYTSSDNTLHTQRAGPREGGVQEMINS